MRARNLLSYALAPLMLTACGGDSSGPNPTSGTSGTLLHGAP